MAAVAAAVAAAAAAATTVLAEKMYICVYMYTV
jgi:hypothetical protein